MADLAVDGIDAGWRRFCLLGDLLTCGYIHSRDYPDILGIRSPLPLQSFPLPFFFFFFFLETIVIGIVYLYTIPYTAASSAQI